MVEGQSGSMELLDHEVILSWMKQKPKFDMDSGNEAKYQDIIEAITTAFIETLRIVVRPTISAIMSSNQC
jgi:hypothetical protein